MRSHPGTNTYLTECFSNVDHRLESSIVSNQRKEQDGEEKGENQLDPRFLYPEHLTFERGHQIRIARVLVETGADFEAALGPWICPKGNRRNQGRPENGVVVSRVRHLKLGFV